MQIPPLFDSWSLSRSPLPLRSQLYSLEPIGIGTASVESLMGYAARLADAHSVSVGDLAGRVLSELSDSKGPVITAAARAWRVGGHGFRVCSYAVNGVTDRAERWVHALEVATTRSDLRSLTLLPFRDSLPGQMFRRHRAWCALCYDDWRARGQIVYEPLYWAIKVSSHCLVHARPLDCVCRHCARMLSPLGVFSRPGHCERCGDWLGVPADDGNRPSGECATWSSTQVGGLLAMLPRVNPFTARDSFRRSLIAYLEQITGGNVLALAQHIRCPPCILQNWLDGATVPRLENLLRTCRFLNIPASSLFDAAGPAPENIAAAKEALARAGGRDVSPSRRASEIRRALREALDEAVPRTLSEVARGLGYTKTERLYQADRTLCHKIAARYRQSGRSHWWRKAGAARICDAARLRQVLEHSLNSNMPTSVYELAATLGYANAGYFQRKYPELCGKISEKIALGKRTRSDDIRSLLENALDERPAPTLKDLSQRLGYSNSAVLRAHQPDLCDRLLARHRTHTLERRANLERMTIEALGETDVPSVRVLCKRLGITVWFMNKYFPAVRRMVAKRHRNCVAAETQRRHERLWRDVHHIAVELRNQGLYPSATRINEHLPQGSCREWKALALAIRDAHNALRISK